MKRWILGFVVLALAGCSIENMQTCTGFTQGTTYTVKYFGSDRDLGYQIDSLLLGFDRQLSTYQKTSYISKWNSGEADQPTPRYFKTVVRRSLELADQTEGRLDITVAPLMQIWGFNGGFAEWPDSSLVDSVMAFIGSDKLSWEDNELKRSDNRIQLDVNAIAQGYSVDVLSEYLERWGIKNYLVEIGGEIRVKGNKPNDQPWRIQIQDPDMGLDFIALPIKDRGFATSGNYNHYVESKGTKYGHTIDPRSGYPALTDMISASIIAADCMTADALATAVMVGGSDYGIELISSDTEISGVLIYEVNGEAKIWRSEDLSDEL